MDPNREFDGIFTYFRPQGLTGRPDRAERIGQDDLLNLRIALALSKDVLDFIEDHHIFMR
jgi:hypothetical protein